MKSIIHLQRVPTLDGKIRALQVFDKAKKFLLCEIHEDLSIKYTEGATVFATEAKEITTVSENFDLFYSNIKSND